MYSFMNDYSEGAHPEILDLMVKANLEQNDGYGEDVHSRRAKEYIKKLLNNDNVDIYIIPGGTQANLIAISAALRPYECVISADTGHINVHEAGAIEATGHKVYITPHKDGKLTPELIQQALDVHAGDDHMVRPKMVYISNTTEIGTIYKKDELIAISNLCKENDLYFFIDGARLGSALTAKDNDMELSDLAEYSDIFYIGGTKNGALLGEALVIVNDKLKTDYPYAIKQRGGLMAKGFVAGIQFEGLFKEDLFFRLGEHANKMAESIAENLDRLGYKFLGKPSSNQVFPILTNDTIDKLSKEFKFQITSKIDENHSAVRFVTSWATTEESVDALNSFFNNL